MNVLLLGSGGREHAMAWKISQSSLLGKLFIAPGNAGTSQCGENVNIAVNDFKSIGDFIISNNIKMLVVGPEDPLVNGLYDYCKKDDKLADIAVIGPSKHGALLEGSKDFAKEFMIRHKIPTAQYRTFNKENIGEAKGFLKSLKPPYVLKADGLAAGKGVLILDSLDEAESELEKMILESKFGEASARVVIEEFLDGIEVSTFVLTDGVSYKILPMAKDYKRIGDGDVGLNTGGMGAVSPVPFVDIEFMEKVEERIVKPTVNGLKSENIPYMGFVFIGLMNVGGDPYVIEYNVRMGDPEAEVVLPRVKSDLLALFLAVANNTLQEKEIEIDERYATTVMLVSGGYPEGYEKGKTISGLSEVNQSIVFHAGTKSDQDKVVTSGGRVIAITSFGDKLEEALRLSYNNAEILNFSGKFYRKDIGKDLMKFVS